MAIGGGWSKIKSLSVEKTNGKETVSETNGSRHSVKL